MQERDMVNDAITTTKASIEMYNKAITECANQQLRSTLQQLRNEAEQLQYQLFQIAEQKGYYKPAPPANSNDVQQVKSGLTGGGMK
ncbi:spore coat protein [Tepidimicrobium xylanilyticum]|uniref:Coat F domain-containing protein n=1 Tax=Tepidimicrobium xylanilyticum TaxID=1123352 RepID=A0A1H3B4F5_9FIRM|nr:spore coat protein [Tepidimicrobium xylanilyticum]GMG97000.1 coat protein F [Tepidimicrobium xylanilyticum]SDX36812.1 Coat F domain-containing protein [Tepidimicrobium xylanilyticum]